MNSPETSKDENFGAPRRRVLGPLFFAVLGIAIILTGGLAVIAVRHQAQNEQSALLRVSGLPASVSTSLANLMSLSPIPAHAAPNFTLTDQRGRTYSLQSFKGRTVVLEFMDPHCIDICPLVSQEFVNAYHDLGHNATKVVFMAVNVNQYFSSVANMATFSLAHQLTTIPSWHFFTGATPDLKKVWRNYGVAVAAPNPNADIVHTSVIYFIDPAGHERYIATPVDQRNSAGNSFLPAAALESWGRGIALVAQSLGR